MSKIADDLRVEMEYMAEDGKTKDLVVRTFKGEDTGVLGLEQFRESSHKSITALLRASKFHYAGADPWENGDTALRITTGYMQHKVSDFLIRCLAEGMMVGYDRDDYRQVPAKVWTELIASNVEQADTYAMNVALDPEAVSMIAKHMAEALFTFSQFTKFSERTGKETEHVWDVWRYALSASSMSMYIIGQRLGWRWKDEEELAGILAATEEVGDGPSHSHQD